MNTDLGLLKEIGERIRIIRSEMNLSKDALGKKICVFQYDYDSKKSGFLQ